MILNESLEFYFVETQFHVVKREKQRKKKQNSITRIDRRKSRTALDGLIDRPVEVSFYIGLDEF